MTIAKIEKSHAPQNELLHLQTVSFRCLCPRPYRQKQGYIEQMDMNMN